MKHEKHTEMVMYLFWGIFLNSLICFKETRTLSMFSSAGSSALTSMWSCSSFSLMYCRSLCILWRFDGSRSLCAIKSALRTRLCRFEGGIWDDIENVLVEEMSAGWKVVSSLTSPFNQVYAWAAWGRWYESYDDSPLGAGRLSIIRSSDIHSIYF